MVQRGLKSSPGWRMGALLAGAILMTVGIGACAAAQGAPPSASGQPAGLRRLTTIKAADYHSLTFSPTDSNILFFGHHNGIMRSTDGGRSWSAVVDRPNFDAMNLAADPAKPQVLWMAGHNVFFKSTDSGSSWEPVTTNLPGLDLHAFATSSADPNTLYAFAVGFGLFKSSDAGTNWDPLPFPYRTVITALASAGTPEVLYVGTDQGLTMSSDGGKTFSQPAAVNGLAPVLAIGTASSSPVVYVATSGGLSRSRDAGASWTKMSFTGSAAALAVDPRNPDRVVAVDTQGGVFSTS